MEQIKLKAFEFASETAKQLIGLASGILALTITFIKDIGINWSGTNFTIIIVSWSFYVLAILSGLWSFFALTGELGQCKDTNQLNIYKPNIQIPFVSQIFSFLIATILLVVCVGKGFHQKLEAAVEVQPKQAIIKAADSEKEITPQDSN